MSFRITIALLLPILGLATGAHAQTAPRDSALRLAIGASFQECRDCPAMVVVPPGQFTMGGTGGEEGRPEWPKRTVTIPRAFAAGKFEISRGQYRAFVEATGHDSGLSCAAWDKANKTITMYPQASWRDPEPGVTAADDEPVVCVSWLDAQAYVAWLSKITGHRYRLPTEAEWEYFARAGSSAEYPWGDDPEQACQYANVYDKSSREPSKPWASTECTDKHPGVAPIGQYPPNAFGLHDVIGNVWEWNQDCYLAPYAPAPVDGSAYVGEGKCALYSVRGGSWRSQMFRQRTSWRGRDPEDRKSNIFGIRVVRDLL
jgi:formylglycine-generating enzyme required for sulfatase activity